MAEVLTDTVCEPSNLLASIRLTAMENHMKRYESAGIHKLKVPVHLYSHMEREMAEDIKTMPLTGKFLYPATSTYPSPVSAFTNGSMPHSTRTNDMSMDSIRATMMPPPTPISPPRTAPTQPKCCHP